MKNIIVSVAYATDNFSKVFIKSFRKFYPTKELLIVDNNPPNYPETTNLKSIENIVYIKNNDWDSSHAKGLDIALKFACDHHYDMITIFDMDVLFLKQGLIERFEEAYIENYKFGGRMFPPTTRKAYIHPACAFYDVNLLQSLNISFSPCVEGRDPKQHYDTAAKICDVLLNKNIMPKDFQDYSEYIFHFNIGSSMYKGIPRLEAHEIFKDPVQKQKYIDRFNEFFNRQDVKEYL